MTEQDAVRFLISRRMLLVGGLIHQAVEFALVCDLQFEKPGLAAGVGIDQRRLGASASLTSSTSPEIGA